MKLRIPGLIRRDFLRKAMAFLFAGVLWLYVSSQLREGESYPNIPVKITYDPNRVSLERDSFVVNVVLRGSAKVLHRVRRSDIRVQAQLPAPTEGEDFCDLALSADNVTVPRGTRVEQIDPPRLLVPVDRIATRRAVPVRVRWSGEVRTGYRVLRCTLVPSVVDVVGPSRLLADVQELVTEPIPLAEHPEGGFEVDVRLVRPARVQPSQETVHAVVEVARETMLQTYEDLPLYVLGDAAGAWVVQEALPLITVTLQGPQSVLQSVDGLALRPFVDLSTVRGPGRYRRPVQVWTGGLTTVVPEAIVPSMVEVSVGPREAP